MMCGQPLRLNPAVTGVFSNTHVIYNKIDRHPRFMIFKFGVGRAKKKPAEWWLSPRYPWEVDNDGTTISWRVSQIASDLEE